MTNLQLGFLRRSAADVPLRLACIEMIKLNNENKLNFVQIFASVKNVEFK